MAKNLFSNIVAILTKYAHANGNIACHYYQYWDNASIAKNIAPILFSCQR